MAELSLTFSQLQFLELIAIRFQTPPPRHPSAKGLSVSDNEGFLGSCSCTPRWSILPSRTDRWDFGHLRIMWASHRCPFERRLGIRSLLDRRLRRLQEERLFSLSAPHQACRKTSSAFWFHFAFTLREARSSTFWPCETRQSRHQIYSEDLMYSESSTGTSSWKIQFMHKDN